MTLNIGFALPNGKEFTWEYWVHRDRFIPWHPSESHGSSAKLKGISEDGIPEDTGLEPTSFLDKHLQKTCAQHCLLRPFCEYAPGVRNAPRAKFTAGLGALEYPHMQWGGKNSSFGNISKQTRQYPLPSASAGTSTAQVMGSD